MVQWHRFFGLVFINKTLAWSMNDDWMIAGNINSGAILNRNLSPKGLADNEINKNYCSCYQTVSNRSLTSWVNSVHYIIVTYPSNTLHKWMALTLGDIELQLIKLTGHSFNQLRTIISKETRISNVLQHFPSKYLYNIIMEILGGGGRFVKFLFSMYVLYCQLSLF